MDKRTLIMLILIWAWIIGTFIALAFLSGCSILGDSSTSDPIQDLTAGQSIAKAIEHTNWLVTLAVIGAGTGFFAFLNGNGIGLKLIASCLVVISLTLMISWAAKWIACIGIAGSVGLMVYTIWIKDKAIKEVVKGNKEFMDNDRKEYLYDVQTRNQSPSTRKIVDNILKKLGV